MSKRNIMCVLCLAGILTHFASHVFAAPPPLVPGNLLVFDSQNNINGIIEIDPQAGTQSVWESGGFLESPTDMVFDKSGNLIVSDNDNGIIRINIATGQQTQVASGNFLTGPTSVTVDRTGDYLASDVSGNVLAPSNQIANVVRIDSQTGVQTLLSSSGGSNGFGDLSDPVDSTLDSAGNLLVSNFRSAFNGGDTGILRVDATTGDVSVVSSGGSFSGSQLNGGIPSGILLNSNNSQDVWVTRKANSGPSVSSLLSVNTITGQQTVISSGGLLQNSGAIAADNGDILVFNASYMSLQSFEFLPATIVGVDPLTGIQTPIYSYSDGDLNTPQAILVIPEPGSLAILCGLAFLAVRRRPLCKCA